MKSIFFRVITIVGTLIAFAISLVLLFTLDFEAHHLLDNGDYIVSLINGKTAIFGGNSVILRGNYIGNELVLDTSRFIIASFAFDYLTVIGLVINILSLIFMIFYFNRQIILLITTIINALSLVFLAFEPHFFLLVNSGKRFYNLIYSTENNNSIISIGIIVFIIINGIIDVFYLIRAIALFKNKVVVE